MNLATGLALAFGVLSLAADTHGQALMLDFGPLPPSEADAVNSPAHAVDAVPKTDTTWNRVGTADVLSGLKYADGTEAAGVSLRTGAEVGPASGIVDFTTNPTVAGGMGGMVKEEIYAGKAPARDGIFNTGENQSWAVGVQIAGLAPGTYTVFVTGRNTNGREPNPQTFHAEASEPEDSFDFGSASSATAANEGTAWLEEDTYGVLAVTVGEGQVLNVAAKGSNEGRGFLNSLQIVATPAP